MEPATRPFGAWPKQVEVMELVRDSTKLGIDEIFLIGPVGSTKTFTMAMTDINICEQFEGCIIPVGRKDLSEAQIGTWEVYMEVLGKMKFEHGRDYTVRQAPNDLRIRFVRTGSIIQFIGMNKSRDRDWSKLKITATKASVDEVDDVEEGGYNMLFSRTGRRNESGAPRCITSACNPNDAWTKRKVYFPWLKRIGRKPDNMPQDEWDEIEPLPANKAVIEFTMEDSPLYLDGYYEPFMSQPRAWRERYLYNNWNYLDDENSLFKIRTMDALSTNKLKRGDRYIAVDPNAGGDDRASITVWEGDTVVDTIVYTTEELKKLALPDESTPMNYGRILGRLTVQVMKRERVGALNVGGDVVGIGQGWLTYMLGEGYPVLQFRSGDAPIQTPGEKDRNIKPPYADLRSQMYALWARDMDNAQVFLYSKMPHLSTLKKELALHEGNSSDKVLQVTQKPKIKKLLGASPDIADSGMMGYWVRMIRRSQGDASTERASVGQSVEELYNGGNGF